MPFQPPIKPVVKKPLIPKTAAGTKYNVVSPVRPKNVGGTYVPSVPTNKFWQSPQFKQWYDNRSKFQQVSPTVSAPAITPTPQASVAAGVVFKEGDVVYQDPITLEYTNDPTKIGVYVVESSSMPGNKVWVKGEQDAKKVSEEEGTVASPVTYNDEVALFFASLKTDEETDIVSNYVEDLSKKALFNVVNNEQVARYIDSRLINSATEEEIYAMIKEWERQGLHLTQFGNMDLEQQKQAESLVSSSDEWTAQQNAQIGAFKKLLPEDWFLMKRAGPSTASEITIWTESPKTGLLEPTLLVKDLSTKMLDVQNVMNSPFGIAVDMFSLRGWIGKQRLIDPWMNRALAYTLDPIMGALEVIDKSLFSGVRAQKVRDYKKLLGKEEYKLRTATPEGKRELLGGTFASAVAQNLNEFFALMKTNIQEANELIEMARENPESVDIRARYRWENMKELSKIGDKQQVQAYLKQQIEAERRKGMVGAEAYREQAQLAMSNGDAESAIEYVKQAQNLDRVLGLSYWEDKEVTDTATGWDKTVTSYQNAVGSMYSKLNSSVYEDWSWVIKPELEQKFLNNLAYSELKTVRGLPACNSE